MKEEIVKVDDKSESIKNFDDSEKVKDAESIDGAIMTLEDKDINEIESEIPDHVDGSPEKGKETPEKPIPKED